MFVQFLQQKSWQGEKWNDDISFRITQIVSELSASFTKSQNAQTRRLIAIAKDFWVK